MNESEEKNPFDKVTNKCANANTGREKGGRKNVLMLISYKTPFNQTALDQSSLSTDKSIIKIIAVEFLGARKPYLITRFLFNRRVRRIRKRKIDNSKNSINIFPSRVPKCVSPRTRHHYRTDPKMDSNTRFEYTTERATLVSRQLDVVLPYR